MADPTSNRKRRAAGRRRSTSIRTVAEAGQFFTVGGAVYDPTRIVAIIDNASVNAATQRLHGVDSALSAEHALGDGSRITASISASYLRSSQRLTAAQPAVPLAGRLFNPPHFRGRAVFGWRDGLLGITAAVNRTNGVIDPRFAEPVAIRGMTTFDLTARLVSAEATGFARGLDVVLSAQNLFNAKPAQIANTLLYDNPYDSTNYSPVGRFIALSVSKSW